MKKILILAIFIFPFFAKSQLFTKNLSETLQNLRNAGFKPQEEKDNPSGNFSFRYKDILGDAIVYIGNTENVITHVTFFCLTESSADNRYLDVVKQTKTRTDEVRKITQQYGGFMFNDGTLISRKSQYFAGDAKYSVKKFPNPEVRRDRFIIQPL